MDEDNMLELLELYMDMVEKQDEIIYRLGKIVARQATDIQLLKNDREFSDDKLTEDTAIVDEVIGQYNEALFLCPLERGERTMEDPITRAEYEEYQKRMEQEDHRQNRRIEQLEENTKQINALTVSIEKLAQSVESMVREQEAQGKRLVSLESKDGEMWRKVVGYVITAVIGIVLGFAFTQIGM